MQGIGKGTGRKKKNAAGAAPAIRSEEVDLFHRGKTVLGDNAGGLIKNLIKAKAGNIALARAAIARNKISATDVTSRPVLPTPATTASVVDPVLSYSSLILLSKNTS